MEVLRLDPQNALALHLYIHLVEATNPLRLVWHRDSVLSVSEVQVDLASLLSLNAYGDMPCLSHLSYIHPRRRKYMAIQFCSSSSYIMVA